MMRYKITKTMFRATEGDTDFFAIVTVVLQGDTWALYKFIIYHDYLLRTLRNLIKENGFTFNKTRCKRYPTETLTDSDYKDNRAFLANAPVQGNFLLHNLKQAARSIDLYSNAGKTEFM